MAKENRHTQPSKVTWAEATRDIIITSINRGQLPTVVLLFALLLILSRYPAEQLPKLVYDVGESFLDWQGLSYAVSIILALGWFIHAKSMRRSYSEEYKRIGREKSKLQNQNSKKSFDSSD